MVAASVIALMLAPQVAQSQLVVEYEIGSADAGLAEAFGYVSDVAADDDGNVYVLDQRADRVSVYSASGQSVRTFGSRDASGGELNRPMRIDVRSDGVTVLNPSALTSTYSPTGELLGSERMPFGSEAAVRIADGWYVVLAEGSISRDEPTPISSVLIGNNATGVDSVLSVPSSDLLFRSPMLTAQIGTSLCGLVHFTIDSEPRLWVASGVDGTLTEWLFVNGARTRGRSIEIAPAAGSLPDSVRAQVYAQLPRQIDATSDDLYTPALLSQVCGLERANDETLWVRLADVDGRERWSAIDTGTLSPTTEVSVPKGVHLSAFSGNRAYGIRTDDARVTRIVVYRIE
jgi:hypothetical protein